ncbi:hypothetical protein AJ80_01543 [Polytolypa hystricis UAMH7299]|uniref:Uncharacterized protein n=1 Tax=Polytolypa hystricis (strain UAMH7299) TaxID=1447883 RepID=A0A2B7Z0X3_POLH7|nr:hypothetical protein AJ80_01543 [Polytolypa hystricis UAMH7299]
MSRRTNAPRRCSSRYRVSRGDIAMTDAPPSVESAVPEAANGNQTDARFLVGLDYGTTYTTVSYIKYDPRDPPKAVTGNEIKYISSWPESAGHYTSQNNPQVPSESWYHKGKYYWGYDAHKKWRGEQGYLSRSNRLIKSAKLLLIDNNSETGPRRDLKQTMKRIGKEGPDVIKDYLCEVFKHTKSELTELEGYTDGCQVELAFCVPAGWSPTALLKLQTILSEIVEELNFGTGFDPFILHEPEAAAAYVLEAASTNTLRKGDVFMVLDAGGGTVDAITYRVSRKAPFRLNEVVTPAGSDCGSTYINQAFGNEVRKMLKDEKYFFEHPHMREELIEKNIMLPFEYEVKKNFDISKGLDGNDQISVNGLKERGAKPQLSTLLSIPRKTIAKCFNHSLQGIKDLVGQQLAAAGRKKVQRLLLVGGFAASPSLRHALRTTFPLLELIYPNKLDMEMGYVVSRGTVYRALDKTNGPNRQIMASYGFLQIEDYDERMPAHRRYNPEYRNLDGKAYIDDCINWLIKKDRGLPNAPVTTRNYQLFKKNERLEIRQRVYFTDGPVRDHHTVDDDVNKGAVLAGRLVVDLNRLKESGLIQPKKAVDVDPDDPNSSEYYEVHYDLVMEVQGRNLKVSLLYPPGQDSQGSTQICIAAALQPGAE